LYVNPSYGNLKPDKRIQIQTIWVKGLVSWIQAGAAGPKPPPGKIERIKERLKQQGDAKHGREFPLTLPSFAY